MLEIDEDSIRLAWVEWKSGIQYEIDFWNRWLQLRGGDFSDDFELRMKHREVDEQLAKVLSRLPDLCRRVLDVGAGPISCLGNKFKGSNIDLLACDPLASQYHLLMSKLDICPPTKTVFAMGEDLGLLFDANSFDVVHMQNALDHSLDPVRVLLEMINTCKVGGYVMLRHAINEAEHENYSGFHRWNLEFRNQKFVIWNKSKSIEFSAEVSGFCDHEILLSEGYLINLFRKKHDVPLGLRLKYKTRYAIFQEAVLGTLGNVDLT